MIQQDIAELKRVIARAENILSGLEAAAECRKALDALAILWEEATDSCRCTVGKGPGVYSHAISSSTKALVEAALQKRK